MDLLGGLFLAVMQDSCCYSFHIFRCIPLVNGNAYNMIGQFIFRIVLLGPFKDIWPVGGNKYFLLD